MHSVDGPDSQKRRRIRADRIRPVVSGWVSPGHGTASTRSRWCLLISWLCVFVQTQPSNRIVVGHAHDVQQASNSYNNILRQVDHITLCSLISLQRPAVANVTACSVTSELFA